MEFNDLPHKLQRNFEDEYSDNIYSEEDKELFANFYEKNKYYKDGYGVPQKVDDNIFDAIAYNWYRYPQELKEKQSLLAFAKYVHPHNQNVYLYGVNEVNENTNSNFPKRGIPEKEFALSQIQYSRDYFPDENKYWEVCKDVLSLPDDKKVVYDFLNQYSMFNLNYIPNKIRLIDDYMPDKINLSFAEKQKFMDNKSLKYEDLTGFQDKKNNFSYSNYLKSVDSVMEILYNDVNAKTIFRKDFQYHNVAAALQYDDYSSYNCHTDYDDEYDYDEDDEENDDTNAQQDFQTNEVRRPNYQLDKDDTALKLYEKNIDYVSDAALNLCRTFGAQVENFISRCLDAYDPDFVIDTNKSSQPNIDMDFEEDIEFFTEQQFNFSHRINALRLKEFSMHGNRTAKLLSVSKNPVCSPKAQTQILDLLNVLPTDFSKDKYASFGKFMMEDFFYKDTAGKLCTRPISEVAQIAKIWPQLTPEQQNLDYKEILALSSTDDYLNAQKSNFVETAKINHLSPQLFDIAQSAYIRGLDTPRVIKEDYELQDQNYTVRLMKVDDPSIMFVGKGFSCQTIDKAGVYPALSSVQDPFSRALVVEQKGKPVGLAWLWVTEEEKYGQKFQSLCIDNLELSDYAIGDAAEILSVVQRLSVKIADENDLRRVTLGAKATHYSPRGYYNDTEPLQLPKVYESQTPYREFHAKINYGDSASQVLLYENFAAQPLKKHDDNQYFVTHRDAYTLTKDEEKQALAVGDAAYDWAAEFREQDQNSKFIMMKNYQNEVVGYALYSDADRHIHDVAVHPDYRRYSKKMLFELLRHMKEVGGTWEAETRKNTSYALLTKLSKAGMINLTEKETFIGIQGEKLYKTYISFPDKKQERTRQISEKVVTGVR